MFQERSADVSRKTCRNFPEEKPEFNSCFIFGKTCRCFKSNQPFRSGREARV